MLDISGSFAFKTKNSNSMLSHELAVLNKGINNRRTSKRPQLPCELGGDAFVHEFKSGK